MPILDSVNIGRPRPNPYKKVKSTGIGKQPVSGSVSVRAPGPKRSGLGSGLVGVIAEAGKGPDLIDRVESYVRWLKT